MWPWHARESWKQYVLRTVSALQNQVSEVRRATYRHAASNLWPPRPLIHMICLRPSSTFTVLAISNVELWRWWWLPLGRMVEVVVEHEGLYFYVLCGYLYILRGLLIVTRYIRVNVQMEMVVTCKPSWSTSRASYWEVVLRRACGTRRFILLYTMWVS